MRHNINKIGLIIIVITLITLNGCRKDELVTANSGFNNLKVFDDTAASAENYSLKIDAGHDKIFMVYGCGAPVAFTGGSIFTLDHQAKILATDLKGELLWKRSIDINLDVCDVIALNDGGCVVVSVNYWGNLNHTQKHIYLNRFDGNGNSILADSVLLPSSISSDYNFLIAGGRPTANGNLLLFGTIYDKNATVNLFKPFSGEYSLSGGWNWIKWYKLLDSTNEACYLSSAIAVDNGYLFAVTANEYAPSYISSAMLFKTSLSGDSLWIFKQQALTDAWVGNSAIVFNGDIYFGYSLRDNSRYTGYISRIDANGLLLNSLIVNDQSNNYISSVQATGSGVISALSNTYGTSLHTSSDPIFSITNTQFIKTSTIFNITSSGLFQSETTDFIPASCVLPDGRTGCFGLIQTKNKSYYKPVLIILE